VKGLKLDMTKGTAVVDDEIIPLNYYFDVETDSSRPIIRYQSDAAIAAEYVPSRDTLVLGDTEILNSVFNQLYLRKNPSRSYFKLVDEVHPAYQIWHVKRDRILEEGN
jgi:hypothetical protein